MPVPTKSARLAPSLAGLFALALGVVACPETFSQTCPKGSHDEGTFTASFAAVTANPDECRITKDADGGPIDGGTLSSAPQSFQTTLCSQALADGGALLYMAVGASVLPRVSEVGPGATFTFTSQATVTGTKCVCAIDVAETISGTLLPSSGADGGAAYDSDAGAFEPLKGFNSRVVDAVDGGAGCRCNVPCNIQYTLNAAK